MTFHYEYTPYIWPILASALFFAVLGVYAIRHRRAPGAIPFAVMTILEIPWVLANALRLVSTTDAARNFWFQVESAHLIPLATASLWFALDYAGLGRWLNRRLLAMLAIFPIISIPLIITDKFHHLVWTRMWFDVYVHASLGPVAWVALVYGLFLSLLQLVALGWLFVRSPRHRWIAIGLVVAAVSIRCAAIARFANWNPIAPMDPMVVLQNLTMLAYATAVFGFRMLDVASVGRDTVVEGMLDGMIVLDNENRIADLNRVAQSLLFTNRSKLIGKQVDELFKPYPDLLNLVQNSQCRKGEVSLGESQIHCLQIYVSPLIDRRGFQLGRLISLHDITEQKRAQAQILDQQRTLAILNEREILARDLHDGIGQMLAAAHFQIKSATDVLTRGDPELTKSYLSRLSEVIQKAKESVGDYLLGVKAYSSQEQGLGTTLRHYIDQYAQDYGIRTELFFPSELEGRLINASVEAQLYPIIQEALANVRKHSGASSARVRFALFDGEIRVTVEDNGKGFDLEIPGEKRGFGLRAMRGRAEMVGARLEVNSAPGKGTHVLIRVPWKKKEV